jgi:hypothetical protein
MTGAPLFFPAILFCKNICQIFVVKKLNKQILVGCLWLQLHFLGANFYPLAVFQNKNKNCRIFPYKLPKIGGKKILENSHLV